MENIYPNKEKSVKFAREMNLPFSFDILSQENGVLIVTDVAKNISALFDEMGYLITFVCGGLDELDLLSIIATYKNEKLNYPLNMFSQHDFFVFLMENDNSISLENGMVSYISLVSSQLKKYFSLYLHMHSLGIALPSIYEYLNIFITKLNEVSKEETDVFKIIDTLSLEADGQTVTDVANIVANQKNNQKIVSFSEEIMKKKLVIE